MNPQPTAAPRPYDSRPETLAHIEVVRTFIAIVIDDFRQRAEVHDASKLVEPELSTFDVMTPKLKTSTYGSPEYKAFLVQMQPALAHHYAHNSHHPEHFKDGIRGMTLMDVLEMLCDWFAATKRHHDGDIRVSIEKNQARFGYSDELKQILLNTVAKLDKKQ